MLQKCEHFCNAVERLAEALTEYAASPASTVIRDGVIQRFEFTFELAWKSLREYMEDQGASMEAVFSKQVFKAAYAAGLIHDERAWVNMLTARNLTSHVYDESTADTIARDICETYLPTLQALAELYRAEK